MSCRFHNWLGLHPQQHFLLVAGEKTIKEQNLERGTQLIGVLYSTDVSYKEKNISNILASIYYICSFSFQSASLRCGVKRALESRDACFGKQWTPKVRRLWQGRAAVRCCMTSHPTSEWLKTAVYSFSWFCDLHWAHTQSHTQCPCGLGWPPWLWAVLPAMPTVAPRH